MNHKEKKLISLPIEQLEEDLSSKEKTILIANHFKSIMQLLGLNLDNDSLKDTPMRVAKMYVDELFEGLDPKK